MDNWRSVMFGDFQYQISRPVRNPDDGYFYQRVREITRAGVLRDELIFRSYQPNSANGLADTEGGFNLAFGMAVYVFDLGLITYSVLGLGNNPLAAGNLGRALNKFWEHTNNGVQYPSGLAVGHKEWSGTSEPWDPSTLKSDQNPQWAPGPLERLFSENTPAIQLAKYSDLDATESDAAATAPGGGRSVTVNMDDETQLVFHQKSDGFVTQPQFEVDVSGTPAL
jgi:hypothetical protein